MIRKSRESALSVQTPTPTSSKRQLRMVRATAPITLTSHASLTAEQRAQAGIPDGFLRFSLGLEDPDDLIADFAQALARH